MLLMITLNAVTVGKFGLTLEMKMVVGYSLLFINDWIMKHARADGEYFFMNFVLKTRAFLTNN